ncbi:hypothetical protein EMIT047CA2_70216 [Pseudomonas soli]
MQCPKLKAFSQLRKIFILKPTNKFATEILLALGLPIKSARLIQLRHLVTASATPRRRSTYFRLQSWVSV